MLKHIVLFSLVFLIPGGSFVFSQAQRPAELGIRIGVMPAGPLDAITDIPGVKVDSVLFLKDFKGHHVEALPVKEVLEIMRKYKAIK